MPFSDPLNIRFAANFIMDVAPKSVLDIGAGSGKYGKMTRALTNDCRVHGVEVWQPYYERFGLAYVYEYMWFADIRHCEIAEDYDIIFLGDILEHMTEAEALAVWEKCRARSRFVFLSIPTIHYPQGAWEGNPYEEHVDEDWSHERVMSAFEGIVSFENFPDTSSYVAKGLL